MCLWSMRSSKGPRMQGWSWPMCSGIFSVFFFKALLHHPSARTGRAGAKLNVPPQKVDRQIRFATPGTQHLFRRLWRARWPVVAGIRNDHAFEFVAVDKGDDA